MLPEDTKELTFAELENFLKPNNISERFTLRAFLKLSKLIEQNFGITLKAQIPFFLIRSLSLPLQKSLEWLMQKNIIKEVRSLSNLFPDEPSFFNYLTEVIPEYKVWAGGVSETPDGALTKMIGEACERYAQTVIDPKKLTQAKFQDLKNMTKDISARKWSVTRELKFDSLEDLDYVMNLVKQAYNAQ